jgi:hypothetical protein
MEHLNGVDIFFMLLSLFITIVITRLIFSIPAIVKNLKAQTAIQIHIALKVGVDRNLLRKELNNFDGLLNSRTQDLLNKEKES